MSRLLCFLLVTCIAAESNWVVNFHNNNGCASQRREQLEKFIVDSMMAFSRGDMETFLAAMAPDATTSNKGVGVNVQGLLPQENSPSRQWFEAFGAFMARNNCQMIRWRPFDFHVSEDGFHVFHVDQLMQCDGFTFEDSDWLVIGRMNADLTLIQHQDAYYNEIALKELEKGI
eukprot:TRINITY_DN55253_c0_g2_i1.p1 TRINITY_DN55253_c0_g2~~TRINITY_DN55253_c0_g2_i1.p1  ORF type:complete len:173 (+),score=22.17 TRINITY_DN55253_c0_g2_i1:113-631(+)